MDEFGQRIIKSLTIEGRRLSRARSTDGFLLRPDTQQHLLAQGLLVLHMESSLEWRARYEIEDKHSQQRVCYLTTAEIDLLPDMETKIADCGTFSLADILPLYHTKTLLGDSITYDYLSYLYEQKHTYKLSEAQTNIVLEDAEKYMHSNVQVLKKKLENILLDWDKAQTIVDISRTLCDIIRSDCYAEAENILNDINEHFQSYIDSRYFNIRTASYRNCPRMVNRVLPYIKSRHGRSEKVALIVIDGMTYWQYLILDKALCEKGIETSKDMTLAWLPSITRLSCQAIFRGDMPSMQYAQNPNEESKLWMHFRETNRYLTHEIKYTHGTLSTYDYISLRQAFVDVSLDEKMHSSTDNKDLQDLTVNWSDETAEFIRDLHEHDYHIYITTDHGNLLAHGWRQLRSEEKTFLYERESRGSRHLIYSKEEYLKDFLEKNPGIANQLLVHNHWVVWRTPHCFKVKDEITHGGAHFLEVVIPFISIERKR